MPLFEKALEQQTRLPPSANLVRILSRMSGRLRGAGRLRRAQRSCVRRAVEVSASLDEPLLLRAQLRLREFDETVAGDRDKATRTAREVEAVDIGAAQPDLVWEGVLRTDILLLTGGTLEDSARLPNLRSSSSDPEEIETYPACLLRSNFVQALVHVGRVAEAARLIDPLTGGATVSADHWPLFIERARLDALRGEHARAATVVSLVDRVADHLGGRPGRTSGTVRSGGGLARRSRSGVRTAVVGPRRPPGHRGLGARRALLVLAARAAADRAGGRPMVPAVASLAALRDSLAP